MCAETKCKLEETQITLDTIERSLSSAKKQLPERLPGIIFIKIPRHWLNDEKFATKMQNLSERFLARSPWVVSIKYYTTSVVWERDASGGENTGEIVAFREHTNDHHQLVRYKGRNWHMFPNSGPAQAPSGNYNGLAPAWQRLLLGIKWQ